MGLARRAEPDPGPVLHLAGLGIGVAAALVLVAAVATRARLAAGWGAPRGGGRGEPGRRVPRTWSTGPPGPGCRRAWWPGCWPWNGGVGQPRYRCAAPWSVVTAGIVALTAALTFTVSLDHLLRTPRCTAVGASALSPGPGICATPNRQPPRRWPPAPSGAFSAVHRPSAPGGGCRGLHRCHRHRTQQVFPTTIEGREPREGPDEIALGTRTLRQLGLRLGQTVELKAGRTATMRIVGRSAGLAGESNSAAATGGILTLEGLQRLDPDPTDGYGVSTSATCPAPTPLPFAASSARRPAELNIVLRSHPPTSRTWVMRGPPDDARQAARPAGRFYPRPPPGDLGRAPPAGPAVLKTLGFVRRSAAAWRQGDKWHWSPWPPGCRSGSPWAAGPGPC